jgi:hypothetical protein
MNKVRAVEASVLLNQNLNKELGKKWLQAYGNSVI